jgi:uncharacterized pyridoxamine 5'-phosphate oxidase family protein
LDKRAAAADAYVRSIRTGEHSASVALGRHLAPQVVLDSNGPGPGSKTEELRGHAAVLERASGNWAITYSLRHARWTDPAPEGDKLVVNASFEFIGTIAPAALRIVFVFDQESRITRIEQRYTPRQPQPIDRIPAAVKTLINNARVQEVPICIAHITEEGVPLITFRGSIQALNDHELCAWIRAADGGLVRSIAKNPAVSLAYRDGPRAMLTIQGRARMDTSPEMRERVFEMIPEQEKNHDPQRTGAAMIITVDRMQGYSTGGEAVRMQRKT